MTCHETRTRVDFCSTVSPSTGCDFIDIVCFQPSTLANTLAEVQSGYSGLTIKGYDLNVPTFQAEQRIDREERTRQGQVILPSGRAKLATMTVLFFVD